MPSTNCSAPTTGATAPITATSFSWPLDPTMARQREEEDEDWLDAVSFLSESDDKDNDTSSSFRAVHAFTKSKPFRETSTCTDIKANLSETYYFLKPLGSGAFGIVYAIISKDFADSFLAGLTDTTPKDIVYDVLRKNMRAIKIANACEFGSAAGQKAMKREIEVMKKVGKIPNVMQMIEYDEEEGLWYTMPLIEGKTLSAFEIMIHNHGIDTYPTQVPEAFAYHLLAQFAAAVLALHEKGLTHGDLHSGNIMLQKGIDGSSYTDLVIVDFGQAITWTAYNALTPAKRKAKFKLQEADVDAIMWALEDTFRKAGEEVYFRSVEARIALADTSEELRTVLQDVVREARQRKESLPHQAMPVAMEEFFSVATVPDLEMEEAIPALRERMQVWQSVDEGVISNRRVLRCANI